MKRQLSISELFQRKCSKSNKDDSPTPRRSPSPPPSPQPGPSIPNDVFSAYDVGYAVKKKREMETLTQEEMTAFLNTAWKPPLGFKWPTEERFTKGRRTTYSLQESAFKRYSWLACLVNVKEASFARNDFIIDIVYF